jgi:hypothetical protein
MSPNRILTIAIALLGSGLGAQSNTVPGLNGRLTQVDSLTFYGRRGAAYPSGEVGMAMLNEMCNPGTVEIPWYAAMNPDHPKFAFLITRESSGRMVQINNWSYCKHAFISTNYQGSCGTCNPGSSGGQRMGLNCADTYGAGNNGDPYYLGPPSEIDPWLGVWTALGSYFDRGDPDVGPPANHDGLRSLSQSQVSAFDTVKNRVIVQEPDLVVPGSRFFYGIQLIHQGESESTRGDNNASRGFTPAYGGGSWSFSNNSVGMTYGSILQHWQGVTLNSARNGNDDGTFYVGVVVTGPIANVYHYEYAVHNVNNNRGAATLRIPLCSSSVVTNAGFKDIDSNALNDWTAARQGNEFVFSAPAGNPQNWNTIYNFWFDCTSAPAPGQVHIDEARIGPGNLTVDVNAPIPGGVARTVNLGAGCGNPTPTITAGGGDATIPNPGFFMLLQGAVSSGMFLFDSLGTANTTLAPGCVQYLDTQSMATHGFYMTGVTGIAIVPMPVPNNAALQGFELNFQAAQIRIGGPVGGMFALSNGLKVRVGNNLVCP